MTSSWPRPARWARVALVLLAGVAPTTVLAEVCRGSVHLVLHEEDGRFLEPAGLDALQATPEPAVEPLPLTAQNDAAPHRVNTLRLAGCGFNGDVMLSHHRRRMVLRFKNMSDLNDVPFVVDAPSFASGTFELDFTTVPGPLVSPTLWRLVGPEPPAEAWVIERDRALVEAWRARDTRTLDALVADDALLTTVDGTRWSKADWLVQVNTRSYAIDTVAYDPAPRVIREPGLAVINGVTRHLRAGARAPEAWRFTRVYVNREGQWFVVADHETVVPPPPPGQRPPTR